MYKLGITLFLFNLLSLTLYSQIDSLQYVPATEHFAIQSALTEGSAAIILLDSGSSRINDDFKLEFTHTTRINILTEEGKNYGKVMIPQGLNDSLVYIRAKSFLLSDKGMIKTSALDTTKIETSTNGQVIEHYFEIPNAKKGAIIEYTYQLIVDDWKNLNNWYFQTEIPVLHSTYTTKIPNYILFYKFLEGIRTLSDLKRSTVRELVADKSTEVLTETYVMDSIPAFIPEEDIPGDDYFVSKIKFHLAEYTLPNQETNYVLPESYEELAYNWAGDPYFRQVNTRADYLQPVIDKIYHPELPSMKLIQSYYFYIRNNFTVDESQGDKSLEEVFKTKRGSSIQLNMLLVKLYNQAGFRAYLSALSTVENRPVYPELPYFDLFNKFICVVRDRETNYFLDPSNKNLLFNMLPPNYVNSGALVISRTVPGFANVDFNFDDSEMSVGNFSVSDSATIEGVFEVKRTGYAVYSFDTRFLGRNRTYNDYLIETIFQNMNWNIKNHEVNSDFEDNKVIKEELLFSRNADSSATNYMEISPIVFNEFEVNPYQKEERQNPLTLYTPISRSSSYTYLIPTGWTVSNLPKSTSIVSSDGQGRFQYEATLKGNTVKINYTLSNERVIVMPEEYPTIRSFFTEVTNTLNQKIVLKK